MPRPSKVSKTDINVLPCRLTKKPTYKFVVTGPQSGGRRWRKFFAAEAQAEAYAHLRRVELSNVGTQGAALTQSQRAEYLDCLAKLEPFEVSLRDAVEMILPTLLARGRAVPVEKAVDAMLKAQGADGASQRHLEDLRSRLGRFERAFPGRLLASISSMEVDTWLRELAVANLTRNNFRRIVGSLFTFARSRGWCAENPVAALGKAKVAPGKVGILKWRELAGQRAAPRVRQLSCRALPRCGQVGCRDGPYNAQHRVPTLPRARRARRGCSVLADRAEEVNEVALKALAQIDRRVAKAKYARLRKLQNLRKPSKRNENESAPHLQKLQKFGRSPHARSARFHPWADEKGLRLVQTLGRKDDQGFIGFKPLNLHFPFQIGT